MKDTGQSALKRAIFLAAVILLGCAAAVSVFTLTARQYPGIAVGHSTDIPLDLTDSFRAGSQTAINRALGDTAEESASFYIPDSAVVCRKPSADAFGIAENDSEITGIVGSSPLVKESELVWKAGTEYYNGVLPEYYSDPSILVIRWKEKHERFVMQFSEIVIADGSQFRRCLSDNSYGSKHKQYASQMIRGVNAVIGMSADYYMYRRVGVVVYQGVVYRNNPRELDYCLIDDSGDMIFKHGGELGGDEELAKYVRDNNIRFSLSFGPVIVENHRATPEYYKDYSLGEVLNKESRAAIGMVAARHYLFGVLEIGDEKAVGGRVSDMAEIFERKGCEKAYELDGGQTAETVFGDTLYKGMSSYSERDTSDIIYFATACGEE